MRPARRPLPSIPCTGGGTPSHVHELLTSQQASGAGRGTVGRRSTHPRLLVRIVELRLGFEVEERGGRQGETVASIPDDRQAGALSYDAPAHLLEPRRRDGILHPSRTHDLAGHKTSGKCTCR